MIVRPQLAPPRAQIPYADVGSRSLALSRAHSQRSRQFRIKSLEAEGHEIERPARAQAAKLIADAFAGNYQIIGLGTGLTINEVIKELSQRLTEGRLSNVRCVPASDVTASECAFHGLPLISLDQVEDHIDVMIDEANELDISGPFSYIAGREESGPHAGRLSIPTLRATLAASKACIVVADADNVVPGRLGGVVPVAIDADQGTWEETAEELDDMFLGDAELWRRSFIENAGPRGGEAPLVTGEGHFIVDIHFYEEGLKLYGQPAAYEDIAREIEGVQGVVAHGLAVGAASGAVVVRHDGPPQLLSRADAPTDKGVVS